MRAYGIAIAVVVLLVVGFGCSSGVAGPVTPDLQSPQSVEALQTGSTYLWGLWEVRLDPRRGSVEIVPVRGAQFTCDVVKFLQPPACPTQLLSVTIDPSTNWATGHVVADVTISHPFPGLDKFTGFDVRGVLIGDGSIGGIADPNILYGGDAGIALLNADGMTRWFNPKEFTSYGKVFGFTNGSLGSKGTNFSATLNPYKYYCTDLDKEDALAEFFADPACPNPRGFFAASGSLTRRFDMQFPSPGGMLKYRFQYAVVASWELSNPSPPQNVPDDFPFAANCPEAFCISTFDQSDMFYNDPSSKGGTMRLLVRVFDHQGAENPDGVSGEIGLIGLETPGGLITTGGYASFDSTALTASLVSEDSISATYLLEVADVDPPAQGEFPVLVFVQSANPSTYDQGFPGFAYPDGSLGTYLLTSVSIGPGVQTEAPVAVASIVTQPPYCPGDPIEFDASGSYDPDGGGIVKYEWDFDGDGTYGDPYDSGTDDHPVKVFATSGVCMVDLRVTDDESEIDTLDQPLELTVGGATWVDDDADPLLADGSFDHPWPTIQLGIDNVDKSCGNGLVLVKDGTYEENIALVSDIVVEGYSTPAPLITTAEGSTQHMVDFHGAQDATLRHFRAEPKCVYDPDNNIYAHGISMGDGAGNVVDDIEFIDNPGGNTCTLAVTNGNWGSGGCTVNNVRVNGYHKAFGGFISVGGQGIAVTNCALLNITFTAASGMGIIRVDSGGSTALIAKNVIGHATFSEPFAETEWVSAMSVSYCSGGTVRNNLIFDINNNLGDTGWTWGLDCEDAEAMTVDHNTIDGLKGPAWIYGHEVTDFNTDPSGVAYRDHIVTNLATTGSMQSWRWAYLGMWASDLPVDYSCAWNVGNAFYDGIHEVVAGAGMVYSDPQYTNPAGDDYRLLDTSPCHDTAHDGTDMGAYGGSDPLTWLPG